MSSGRIISWGMGCCVWRRACHFKNDIDMCKGKCNNVCNKKCIGENMRENTYIKIETLYRKRIISKVQYKKIHDAFRNNSVDEIISHISKNGATIKTQRISLKSNCSKAETTNDFVFSDWP
jgi:hypothetical protein